MTYYTITRNGKDMGCRFFSYTEAAIALSDSLLQDWSDDKYDIQPVEE